MDLTQWNNQIEKYINSEIRKNKDVEIIGADGDVLTIIKDTAGKAKFRNYIEHPDGTKTQMSDNEYAAKLRAEGHIDEVAEVSVRGRKDVEDHKKHQFAKDGFNYRTAYFLDQDGSYYKLTISVGKNGEINTIYNVGKMKEVVFPLSGSKAGQKNAGGSTSNNKIPQNNSDVKTEMQIALEKAGINSSIFEEGGKYSLKDKIQVDMSNTLYVAVSLEEIKNGSDFVVYAAELPKANDSHTPSTSTYMVADILKNVNSIDEDFIKYIPDGFLDSERLEAKKRGLEKEKEYIAKKNKKRTNNWLKLNRLQLPLSVTKYGPIKMITYPGENSKGFYEFSLKSSENGKTDMAIALENATINSSIFEEGGKYSLKDKIQVDMGNTLYVAVSLEGIKKGSDFVVYAAELPKANDSHTPSTSTCMVADILKNVNSIDEDFIKYIPDGFLDSERLEAKKRGLEKEKDF